MPLQFVANSVKCTLQASSPVAAVCPLQRIASQVRLSVAQGDLDHLDIRFEADCDGRGWTGNDTCGSVLVGDEVCMCVPACNVCACVRELCFVSCVCTYICAHMCASMYYTYSKCGALFHAAPLDPSAPPP